MSADAGLRHPWALRLPRGALTVGGPVVLLAATALSIAVSSAGEIPLSVAEVRSPTWVLMGVAVGMSLGAVVMLVRDPHRTAVWAPATAALVTVDAETRTIWVAATAVLVALAVADRVGTEHQRTIVATWPVLPPPDVPADARAELLGRRLLPLGAAVLCLLGALVAAGLYVRDAQAAEGFWAEAVPVSGVVTQVADDALSVQVRTADGRDLRVPTPLLAPEVGDPVDVLERRADGRTELLGDPFDPSGALIPAGALLVTGLGLAGEERSRRRRVRRTLGHGGPGLPAVATVLDDRWIELADLDGRLLCVVPAAGLGPVLLSPSGDSVPDRDGEEDDLWDEGPWDEEERPELGGMTDDELLSFSRAMVDEVAASDTDEHDHRSSRPVAPFAVTVHGLTSFGDQPLLEVAPGSAEVDEGWLVAGPARDRPLDLRRLRLRRPRPALPAQDSPTSPVLGHPARPTPVGLHGEPRLSRADRFGRATGGWLPWALLPVGSALLVPLGREVGSTLLLGLPWALAVYGWSASAHPRVATTRVGIRVRGVALDTLVPWSAVRRIVHDEVSTVVRVDPPQDAWFLVDEPRLGPVLSGARDPAVVARTLEDARLRAGPASRARWAPPHLPTPSAALAVLWGALVVGAALLA